jgi:hypothetical protein
VTVKLNVFIDEQMQQVEVPDDMMQDAEEFFARMDADMDKGWQMSREWIENPNTEQRCQIAADRMLTAIMQENENTKILMAGYILSRMPKATDVRIDTSGEILGTEFIAY